MTPAEEDALVTRVMETEWDERELRLAIRAAVAAERERCAKEADAEARMVDLVAKERDEAREELARVREERDSFQREGIKAMAERDAAVNMAEINAKDGARYRWLRDNAGSHQGPEIFIGGSYHLGAYLDAAIDAARKP